MSDADRRRLFWTWMRLFLVGYVVGALLTYGYVWHRPGKECAEMVARGYTGCRNNAAVVGIFWPLYWSGSAALWVTDPQVWKSRTC
jgi:hypothetical protein